MSIARLLCVSALSAVLLSTATSARRAVAAEGAASNYFPGSYGNLLVAVAPEPGFLFWNQNFFYAGKANRAVLQGRVNVNVEADAFFTLLNGYYVQDLPSLGARLLIGGYLPFGYSALEAGISTMLLPPVSIDSSRFNFGDLGLVPASLYWTMLRLTISLPNNR